MTDHSSVRLLDEAAKKNPSGRAITDSTGSITYSELKEKAAEIGAAVNAVAKGSGPVLICLPKSAMMIECMFGALYSARAYVPSDSGAPPARLEKIIRNLCPSLIITCEGSNVNPDIGAEAPVRYASDLIGMKTGPVPDKAPESVKGSDPAYIMYTSGSTGEPKGVTIPHMGIVNFALWAKRTFGWDENSVIANQAPLYFDVSVMDVYGALAAAAELILTPEALFRFPSKLPEFLRDNRVTSIYWVPTVMIRIANSGALEGFDIPTLKSVAFAGEVMPNLQLNIWRKALPGRIYANLYGPTETDVCTAYIVDREFDDSEPLPIGNAISEMKVILSGPDGKPSDRGEILVSGTGVTLGYWNDPERTEKAFAEIETDGIREKYYKTGDNGYLNERGEIMFTGRIDGQIKLGGNRIELGEVENAARMVDGVKNVCALLDAKNSMIVLFAEAEGDIPIRVFKRTMLKYVPSYMIPEKVVLMSSLPHNANDKIDRALLKRQLEE